MSSLYCPRCERPLEGHDDGACRRKISRRFFFGLLGGAAAAVAASKIRLPTGGLFDPKINVADQYAYAKFDFAASHERLRLICQPFQVGDVFTITGINRMNPPGKLREFKVIESVSEREGDFIIVAPA